MTTTFPSLPSRVEDHPPATVGGSEWSAAPTRNELMASACEKLGEGARRLSLLQAKLRRLGAVH